MIKASETIDQEATTARLLAHLWRGGAFGYYWTPDGERYVKDGKERQAKNSYWTRTDAPKPPPSTWWERNLYFGVHPTTTKQADPERDAHRQRATNATVAAVNCLFAEFDGKDFVRLDELDLPADIDELDRAKQDEVRAAARLAAFVGNPALYLARARQAIALLPLTPSVIVASGGGFHIYFLLAETVSIDDDNRALVGAVQAAWVQLVRSDNGAKDLARVLRMPGSRNRKYAPDCPVVSIEVAEFDQLYSFVEFEALTAELRTERKQAVARIGYGTDNYGDEFERAADALRRLAPWRADDRDAWIKVGHALKAGLGDAGLTLWDQWSQGSYKYTPGDCDYRWKTLHPNGVTIATVHGWANEDNPRPKREHSEEVYAGFGVDIPDCLPAELVADGEALPAPAKTAHKTWPYSVKNGRMVILRENKDGDVEATPIADFTATITEEIADESGNVALVIAGKGIRRGAFRCEIGGGDFGSDAKLLSTLTEVTGGIDIVYPNMSKHLRPAIGMLTADESRPRRTRYYRTGWQDSEFTRFLLPGMDANTLLSMPAQMAYSAPPADADLETGLYALRCLIEALDPVVTTPVVSGLLMPPLLRPAGWGNERVALFIAGRTGSLKTSWTQTAMCLYGHEFISNDKLLKFGEGATRNAIMGFAAHAHDLPLFIDNFKPNTGNGKGDFINLIHNILEGGDRKRSDRNGNLRESKEIHCIPIATGEDVPRDDAASLARIILVPYAWQRGESNDNLTEAQRLSRHLNAVGYAWILWIAGEGRAVIRSTAAQFPAYRSKWAETLRKIDADSANIARVASNLAVNELTWETATQAPGIGATLQPFTAIYRRGLLDIARTMSRSTAEAMEAIQWRNAIRELLASGQYTLVDRALGQPTGGHERDRLLGWQDSDGVYLLPEIALSVARKLLGPNSLPVSSQTLYGQMEQLGWLAHKDKEQTTRVMSIGGRKSRMLHLLPTVLAKDENDGDETEDAETQLRELGL